MVPHHDSIQNVDQAHFDQAHDQDSNHHKQLHHPEVTDYINKQSFKFYCIINRMFKIKWCIIQISHYQDKHHLQEHITYQEQMNYQVQFHQDSSESASLYA